MKNKGLENEMSMLTSEEKESYGGQLKTLYGGHWWQFIFLPFYSCTF